MNDSEHPWRCPSSDALVDLVAGEVDPATRDVLRGHIDECAECRAFVAALVRVRQRVGDTAPGGQAEADTSEARVFPTRVGRYTLLEPLGAGSMGSVVAAYDDVLDRKIALKLFHAPWDGREVVVREARAMARVSHPNVVTVYEAGDDDGRVYVAMEYVDGSTLHDWLTEPRTWEQVVDMFTAAAHGLAAAHEVGVIHRDFKPENVVVTRSQQPKVADFGLAGTAPEASLEITSTSPARQRSRIGPGTPVYMAPELLRGGAADRRSDQYALCVSLHEALFGVRPFEGDSVEALAVAIEHSRIRFGDRVNRVPVRVRKIVERGLAFDPRLRWPDVRELARALARARRPWWRSPSAATVAALGLVVTVSLLGRSESPACTGAAEALERLWSPLHRDAIADAIASTGAPYRERTQSYVFDELDAFAAQWQSIHTETCEAAVIRKERSIALMDRQMACLHRAKFDLEATVRELQTIDSARLPQAQKLVDGLPDLDRCADPSQFVSDAPDPWIPEPSSDRADAIAKLMSEARAQHTAGRFAASVASANQALAAAQELGHEPLVAKGWIYLGAARAAAGDYDEAEAAYSEGLHRSLRTRQREAADAARGQAHILAARGMRLTEAEIYASVALSLAHAHDSAPQIAHAESVMAGIRRARGNPSEAIDLCRAAIARIPTDRGANAMFQQNLASALLDAGRFQEAREAFLTALSAMEDIYGTHHPFVATVRVNASSVLRNLGEYELAEAMLREAARIQEAALGSNATDLAITRSELANTLVETGRVDAGITELFAAIAVLDENLGTEHWITTSTRLSLASALDDAGRTKEARDIYVVTLPALVSALGPQHHFVARTRSNYAIMLGDIGEPLEAEALFRQALRDHREAPEPDRSVILTLHHNFGALLETLHRPTEAGAEFTKAMALARDLFGESSPEHAAEATALAGTLVAVGRHAEAFPLLKTAAEIHLDDDELTNDAARTLFDYARLLDRVGNDRLRARSIATQVLERYVDESPEGAKDRAEVERWIRTLDRKSDRSAVRGRAPVDGPPPAGPQRDRSFAE